MIETKGCQHNKASWKTIVCFLLSNCEYQGMKLIVSVIIFIVFTLIKLFLPFNTCGTDVSNIFVTVFSNLLGFSIAGYAILLSLRKEIVCILLESSEEYSNNHNIAKGGKGNPYEVLTATFTYCCIILLFTNAVMLFYNNNILYLMVVFFCVHIQ